MSHSKEEGIATMNIYYGFFIESERRRQQIARDTEKKRQEREILEEAARIQARAISPEALETQPERQPRRRYV